MDISDLAAHAVGLVANHLQAIASGVIDRAEKSATGRLYELIRDRLRRSPLNSAVLDGLEEQPGEPTRRSMAASALAEAAAADPEFAARLHQVVQGVTEQSTIQRQANVSAGGNLTMSRSHVAGGNIDASRKFHLGTGGIALAVLAFLVLGGGTAAVVIGTSDGGGDTDPATIGRDEGEAGVRETVDAFTDAVGARNAVRYCSFLSIKIAPTGQRSCEEFADDVLKRLPPDIAAQWKTARIESVRIGGNGQSAEARVAVENVGRRTVPLTRELGRWVITQPPGTG